MNTPRDAPNAWPPHQYIVLKALHALSPHVAKGNLPQPSGSASTYSLIPNNQLGMSESELPPQPISKTVNASTSGSAADIHKGNGTVWNGGNATSGEGWSKTLQRELANRYFASSLCSWWVSSYNFCSKYLIAEYDFAGELQLSYRRIYPRRTCKAVRCRAQCNPKC
jgi:hypothetical protein